MKLYYIPNFSRYRISKSGDIYEYDTMKQVYLNGCANGLPKLINDKNEKVELTRNDIAAAYYGILPNLYRNMERDILQCIKIFINKT